MQKRIRQICSLACALLLLTGTYTQAAGNPIDQMVKESRKEQTVRGENWLYEAGDVVGFIGDSITHVEYTPISYVEFLYNFYLSRFPHEEIELRNLGVSSYKASDILDIYDRDQAFRGLTKAVIMLGMNEALQEVSADIYIANMEKLVGRLKEDGLKGEDIVVLSPTPYDETCSANFDRNGNPYRRSDRYLTEYTEQLEKKTREWGVRYVDLHTPMLELTAEIQKTSTDNTLTVYDCVHPNAMGEMVMAYHLLKAQGAEPIVSQIVIPEEGQPETVRTSVVDFYRGDNGLCWNMQPEALPMAMTYEYQEFGKQLFNLVDQLNRSPLQIEGLGSDEAYTIFVNSSMLGTFTGTELEKGINLAVQTEYPLQTAMQEVEALNQQWHPTVAAYRTIVRYATMAVPTHTMEQMQEAYTSWKAADQGLRETMYEKVQEAVEQEYEVVVVKAGGSVETIRKEADEARKAAEREAAIAQAEANHQEEIKEEKAEEDQQDKGNVGKKIGLTIAGVFLIAAVVFLLGFRNRRNCRNMYKRTRRPKK